MHDGLGRVRYNEDSSASATGRLYVCGWAKQERLGRHRDERPVRGRNRRSHKRRHSQRSSQTQQRILPPPPSNTITASKWFKLDAVEEGESDREETEEEDVEEKSESNKKALNVRSRKPRTKIVDPRRWPWFGAAGLRNNKDRPRREQRIQRTTTQSFLHHPAYPTCLFFCQNRFYTRVLILNRIIIKRSAFSHHFCFIFFSPELVKMRAFFSSSSTTLPTPRSSNRSRRRRRTFSGDRLFPEPSFTSSFSPSLRILTRVRLPKRFYRCAPYLLHL